MAVLIAHCGVQWPFLYMMVHACDLLVSPYGWTTWFLLATHLRKSPKGLSYWKWCLEAPFL